MGMSREEILCHSCDIVAEIYRTEFGWQIYCPSCDMDYDIPMTDTGQLVVRQCDKGFSVCPTCYPVLCWRMPDSKIVLPSRRAELPSAIVGKVSWI